MYDAGYKTLHDVSVANPRDLVQKIINMPHKVARHIISTAKVRSRGMFSLEQPEFNPNCVKYLKFKLSFPILK